MDLLVKAFSLLSQDFQNAELHLIGGVADHYGPEFERLLESCPARERIRLWGYQRDYQPLLRSGTIYVQSTPPSRAQESFCCSVVEAMAFGIPVVCFASGSLAEIVVDGATGLICKEETPSELAKCIALLLNDPALQKKFATAGADRFANLYSPAVTRQRWLTFFRQVAGCRPADTSARAAA
jgi:glycosyltransferase involved in cell wall biosynthesis